MLFQAAYLGDDAAALRDETDDAAVHPVQASPEVTDVWLLIAHAGGSSPGGLTSTKASYHGLLLSARSAIRVRRSRGLFRSWKVAFVDIDSMQRRVYGHKKQGAALGHTKIP